MQTTEQRLERLEKWNKRLMTALTLMAVAVCAVVTLAATNVRDVSNSENGRWEFHRDGDASGYGHLLHTSTGDIWRIRKTVKEKVLVKK